MPSYTHPADRSANDPFRTASYQDGGAILYGTRKGADPVTWRPAGVMRFGQGESHLPRTRCEDSSSTLPNLPNGPPGGRRASCRREGFPRDDHAKTYRTGP